LSRGHLIALSPPEELRRMASGGDVIQIKTAAAFDGIVLEHLPGVREVRQHAPREMLVITDNAATATPRVVEAIQAAGGDVETSSEYRPNFDEVFSTLVARAEGTPEKEDSESDERVSARAA
jgi:ABC-type multidrug transport system ATPase subunit